MNSPLTWSDQPAILAAPGTKTVFSTHFNSRSVEVRLAPTGSYFVTTGNLFGSQTIACPTAMHVFKVLEIAAHLREGGDGKLPEGCELIEGPEPSAPRL